MSDKYDVSPRESEAILDLDELLLLRSIHGKLDGYRPFRRSRPDVRAGDPSSRLDLDLRLIW